VKIAWFTPLSQESAVGFVSSCIVRELSALATVHVWHPQTTKLRSTSVPTFAFERVQDVDQEQLRRYDLVIYNIGNHLPYHRIIHELSLQVPGVIILHDVVMQHFFISYYLERLRLPELYRAAMEKHYGPVGGRVAEGVIKGGAATFLNGEDVARYPLFEEAIIGAYGVVVHSYWAQQRIERVATCPVGRLYLPYEIQRVDKPLSRAKLGLPDDRLVLLTMGHINSNRRVSSILHVLAEDECLRGLIKYVVVGAREPECDREIHKCVRRYGLEGSVLLTGWVPEEVLASYIQHADLCVNLRWPAFESGSASLAEQMLYGKPIIVTNTGIYSELPDDCVCKISPERELEELGIAIKRLANDGSARGALGQRAREFAERHFSPKQYAVELLRFAWEIRNCRPLLELSDRLGDILQSMVVTVRMPIVSEVSRTCAELFGEGDRGRG